MRYHHTVIWAEIRRLPKKRNKKMLLYDAAEVILIWAKIGWASCNVQTCNNRLLQKVTFEHTEMKKSIPVKCFLTE